MSIDIDDLGVDLLTIVGHKFGAPKGIAALYIREGITFQPMLSGGDQEGGRRAGTENVLLIVGIGEASRIALAEECQLYTHMIQLKLRFIRTLNDLISTYNCTAAGNKIFHKYNGPVLQNNTSELERILCLLQNETDKSTIRKATQLPNTISISFKDVKVYSLYSIYLFIYSHHFQFT